MNGWMSDRPMPDAEDLGADECQDYLESCGCVVHSDDDVGRLVDRLKSYVDSNWFWSNPDIQVRQQELEDILQGYFGFSKERIEEIKHEATIAAKGKVLRGTIGVICDDIPESDG